ncbi:hypothetical protein [Lysinibacillus xylanilyticus]|uniref:hypothetical protein n=1 Tax=Lysinibacillus xylanilyticus TaxID=582475 RepID=UPI003D08227B
MRKRSANVAAATNVLSARKRSVSGKCFICAKVQRQQQQSAQPERKSTTRFKNGIT